MKLRCILWVLPAFVTSLASAQNVPADDPAINPPPISMKLDAATPVKLASELSAITGASITAPAPVLPAGSSGPARIGPPAITIDIANVPFWTLCDTLTTTFGITFHQADDGSLALAWPLYSNQHPLPPKGTTWAGFLICPFQIERHITASAQRPALPPADLLRFQFTLMADPRIKITSFAGASITSMRDSDGKDLLAGATPTVDAGHLTRNLVGQFQPFQPDLKALRIVSISLAFPFPARHSKTATLKGEAHYQLQDNRTVAVPFEFKDFELPR